MLSGFSTDFFHESFEGYSHRLLSNFLPVLVREINPWKTRKLNFIIQNVVEKMQWSLKPQIDFIYKNNIL